MQIEMKSPAIGSSTENAVLDSSNMIEIPSGCVRRLSDHPDMFIFYFGLDPNKL